MVKGVLRSIGLAAGLAAATHALTARAVDPTEQPAPQPSAAADAPANQPATASGGVPTGGSEEIPRPPAKGPSQPGYVINTAQGDTLVVGGYIHADFRAFVGYGSDAYVDQFLLRQARPVLEGTIRDRFDYRLLTDFAGGKVVVQEAFGDVRFLPYLKLRVGKFKSPVGLERLQNSNAVVFAERAFPTNLAPNRDTGVQVFGEIDGLVTYAIALLDGAADKWDHRDRPGQQQGGRRAHLPDPVRTQRPRAAGGARHRRVRNLGRADGDGRVASAADLPVTGSEHHLRLRVRHHGRSARSHEDGGGRGRSRPLGRAGLYYAGPLGLQGEYIDSRQRVKKGATALDADHRAWAVTASFVLTGERATYRMIVPDRPFDPATGRWGALELAGRYQWIRFDDALFVNDVFADARQQVRGAHAWGAGINWYLDRSFRIMLDYDRTGFLGGASSGGQEIDRTPEQVLIGRAQIVF